MQPTEHSTVENEEVYETPAVVYEGTISTRAGSPIGAPLPDDAGTDLFGE